MLQLFYFQDMKAFQTILNEFKALDYNVSYFRLIQTIMEFTR